MTDAHGYIRISRKMTAGADPFWTERRVFSRAEAWIDMLMMAAWRDSEILVKGHFVRLLRGQLLASSRFLGTRWSWDKGRVQRYLMLLVEIERITLEMHHPASQVGNIVTIVNYSIYQGSRDSDAPADEPVTSQGRDSGETVTHQIEGSKKEVRRNKKEAVVAVQPGSAAPPAPAGAILEFPCRGEGEQIWHLTLDQVEEWQQVYPEMSIQAEARKALAWLLADRGRLKTARGMPRFLVQWFNNGQNSGRYVRHGSAPVRVNGFQRVDLRRSAGDTTAPPTARKLPNPLAGLGLEGSK